MKTYIESELKQEQGTREDPNGVPYLIQNYKVGHYMTKVTLFDGNVVSISKALILEKLARNGSDPDKLNEILEGSSEEGNEDLIKVFKQLITENHYAR